MSKTKVRKDMKEITCDMVCEFAGCPWPEGMCYCDIRKGPVDTASVRKCKYLGTKRIDD